MTIGKELLVSNLLTTLLWCQAANVLVESSYSFLDSLHQYACPFSTEFCDDLHLGTVLIHETSYNNRNQWYCNTVATTEEQVHLIRTTTAVDGRPERRDALRLSASAPVERLQRIPLQERAKHGTAIYAMPCPARRLI